MRHLVSFLKEGVGPRNQLVYVKGELLFSPTKSFRALTWCLCINLGSWKLGRTWATWKLCGNLGHLKDVRKLKQLEGCAES